MTAFAQDHRGQAPCPNDGAVTSSGTPKSLAANVVYIFPNKQGGVASVIEQLVRGIGAAPAANTIILTERRDDADTRTGGLSADSRQITVQHALPFENVRAVLRRLAKAVPHGPGVLVANDYLELAMLAEHEVGRSVVQIVHGDYEYYYGLAERYAGVIDAFVACSDRIYETLCRRLPQRRDSIFHLPYGVSLPEPRQARPAGAALRLCFVGRLVEGKGIFDLPEIDRRLAERNIDVQWSVVGDGPDRLEFERRAQDTRLRLFGSLSPARVQEHYQSHDCLVLPTRAEGFPIVLLESMAAGLVPVVSDLPSGIPELVTPATGFRPAVGDIDGFVSAVSKLAADDEQLETMSRNARTLIADRHDATQRAAGYSELFERLQSSPRRIRTATSPRLGSRLDQPWIPNWFVRGARTLRQSWTRPSKDCIVRG